MVWLDGSGIYIYTATIQPDLLGLLIGVVNRMDVFYYVILLCLFCMLLCFYVDIFMFCFVCCYVYVGMFMCV